MRRARVPVSLALLAGTAYGLFAAAMSYVFTRQTGRSLWSLESDQTAVGSYLLAMNLVIWVSWALLVPAIMAFSRRVGSSRQTLYRTLPIHLVGGFAFTTLNVLIVAGARFTLQRAYGLHPVWSATFVDAFLRSIDWELAIYWAIVAFTFALDSRYELRERELAAARLQAELLEARLQGLQRQLQPHFLFNTLQAIAALVRARPAVAELMIERLSEMLRLALKTHPNHEIPLRQELDVLESYLEIQRMHFGDRLRVVVDVEPGAEHLLVPVLLLQPLVENAIRHGIEPTRRGGTVWITARADDAHLRLDVRDDGTGGGREQLAADDPGIGLTNTQQRLRHLYEDNQSCALTATGAGCTVRIVLPRRPAPPPVAVRTDVA